MFVIAFGLLPGGAGAEAPPFERLVAAHEIGALESGTVALLLSGNQGGQVAGAVLWTVVPGAEGGGPLSVRLYIDVDGTTLLASHQSAEVRVGIFVYAIAGDGRIAGHFSQGVNLDLDAYGEPLRTSGLKFTGRLALPAGTYSLRVLVRNQDTGHLFLAREELEVPAAAGGGVALLPPLFPEPQSAWVEARQNSLSNDEFVLDLDDEHFVPAARAVLVTGKATRLVLGGAGWDGGASVSARLMDVRGRRVTEPRIKLDGLLGPGSPAIAFYHATLDPVDVPFGPYRLVITVASGSNVRAVRSTPVVVIPSGGSMVWASIELDLGREAVPTPGPVDLTRGAELEPDTLAAAYLEAVRLLAEGDPRGAVEAVADLERTANAIRPVKALAVVRRAEAEVALELAEINAANLVPVVLLHRAVFRLHLANRDHILADHASGFTSDLAEVAAGAADEGVAPGFAETVLISMAGDLVDDGSVKPALRLLDRALEVAPSNRAALLGQGVALERLGHFREAVDPLERLIESDPGNSEASLRLAVNLARTGHEKDAEPLFRSLLDSDADEWLVAIAYQEFARMLMAAKRTKSAETIIRQGLERLPNSQPLHILLAYLLDLSGRPWESAIAVGTLRPSIGSEVTAPRLRYVMWPVLGIDMALMRFAEEAETIQPRLLEDVVSFESRRSG